MASLSLAGDGQNDMAVDEEDTPYPLTQVLAEEIGSDVQGVHGWQGNAQLVVSSQTQASSQEQECSEDPHYEMKLFDLEQEVAAKSEAEMLGSDEQWETASCAAWYDKMQAIYPKLLRPLVYNSAQEDIRPESALAEVSEAGAGELPLVSASSSSEGGVSPNPREKSEEESSPKLTSALITPRRLPRLTARTRRRLRSKTSPDKRWRTTLTPSTKTPVQKKINKNNLRCVGSRPSNNKVASRDAWIRWMLGEFGPHEQTEYPTVTNWSGLKQVWNNLSLKTRSSWCESIKKGHLDAMVRPSIQELLHSNANEDSPSETTKSTNGRRNDEFCDKTNGHRGGMLTWHGRWGMDREEVKEIMHSEEKLERVVEMIRESSFYKQLWNSFNSFMTTLLGDKQEWPEISITMEVTRNRRKAHNLVHFHCAFSDAHRYHRKRDSKFYEFLHSKPHFAGLEARGQRGADRARSRLHYYIMAPKCGTVFDSCTFKRGEDYQVHSDSIMNLWRLRKIDSENAKRELIHCRVAGFERCMREIDLLAKEEQRMELKMEWQRIIRLMPEWPFEKVDAVEAWKEELKTQYGNAGRFPFLVLNGPSQFGKTRYAQSLFGKESSLLVSCQNVAVPNLRSFQWGVHKAIIYDEANAQMVVDNKAIFQGNYNFQGLGQSVCNQHFYEVFLYGVPQIVCCNDWMKQELKAEDREWLNKNATLVEVTKPLFIAPSEE